MTSVDFLDAEALEKLTGRKQAKKQIEHLRKMGIAFHVNARGRPVVLESTLTGNRNQPKYQRSDKWEPAVLK